MKQNIITSVVSAVILAVLITVWSWIDRGGLISALQGVTKENFQEHKNSHNDAIPAGAIIMTTLECAALGKNWKILPNSGGRFPLAAGSGKDINGVTYNFPLDATDTRGEYEHTLSVNTLPKHDHIESQITASKQSGDERRRIAENHQGVWGGSWGSDHLVLYTESEGEGKAHNNLPPYIILNFCTKLP